MVSLLFSGAVVIVVGRLKLCATAMRTFRRQRVSRSAPDVVVVADVAVVVVVVGAAAVGVFVVVVAVAIVVVLHTLGAST